LGQAVPTGPRQSAALAGARSLSRR
jgi:hypothetical protein